MTARALAGLAAEGLLGPQRRQALLALAGVIAGTGAVVASLSIADGARAQALAEIGDLGLDTIVIRASDLSDTDVGALRRQMAGIADVAAVSRARLPVETASGTREMWVLGVTANWPAMTGIRIASGRSMRLHDDDRARRVAWSARESGWAMIDGDLFQFVGRIAGPERARRVAGLGVDLQEAVVVPLHAIAADARPTELVLRASVTVDLACDRARQILARRGIGADRYDVIRPRELLAARERASRGLTALVMAIGLLALAASGVGIMNLMLAIVMARVGEIALRRAVGATRRDVLLQFTIEGGLLAAAGSVAGTAVGVLFAAICSRAGGWPAAVAPWSLVMGFGVAFGATMGCVAYPARLAARIAPAEALRPE
jgi:putative ABC transport system permease protein